MDVQMNFARTDKGRNELLGDNRTVKPRARQVLFLIGEVTSVAELVKKLPGCKELEGILDQLWKGEYIKRVEPVHTDVPPSTGAANAMVGSGIEAAKEHALGIIRALVGERSPVYAKVTKAQNHAELVEAVKNGKKVIAAVASATHSNRFETEVLSMLGGK